MRYIKNIFKIAVFIFSIEMLVSSCRQETELNDSGKKAYITINNKSQRTVNPKIDLESGYYGFVLKGTREGEEEKTLGEWEGLHGFDDVQKAVLTLDVGTWNFEFIADSHLIVLRGEIKGKEIIEGINNLEFELSVSSITNNRNVPGSIYISFPELPSYIKKMIVKCDSEETKVLTKDNNGTFYYYAGFDPGTYILDFIFYDDVNNKLGTYSELVNVVSRHRSSAVIKNIDLTKPYKINYELNGGNFSDAITIPATYSCYSETIILPNVSRVGYDFEGWYTNSNFNGEPVTELLSGNSGDKYFYVKWKPAIVKYTVNHLLQNVDDDEYTLESTETLEGKTESLTEGISKEYTGFELQEFSQEKIAPDGSTIVNIKYNRKIITLNFDTAEGSAIESIKGKYGAAVPAVENPTREDCFFEFWTPALPEKFPLEDSEYIARWFIKIKGKKLKPTGVSGSFFETVSEDSYMHDFYISETELTYARYYEVYNWAIKNGYSFEFEDSYYVCRPEEGSDFNNVHIPTEPTEGCSMPVSGGTSMWDLYIWCNAASEMDGLEPYYLYNGKAIKSSGSYFYYIKTSGSNGYRLPTCQEWEYAARGADPESNSWRNNYTGSDAEKQSEDYEVINSKKTANVGTKKKNSAGLYDMNGNVCEAIGFPRYMSVGSTRMDAMYYGGAHYIVTPESEMAKLNYFIKVNNGNQSCRLARSVIE